MASGGEIIVDLSDNDDDDDCVLESVVYKSKSNKNKSNYNYDDIFKENALLAEVIEKCINLEHSPGMLRVINKTLLNIYKDADPKFKGSSEFQTMLKKTLIRLDKDPDHKFSHLKVLCEKLRSSKFKKYVEFITLEKNLKRKDKSKLALKRKSFLELRSKRAKKSEIIDLDKYEEIPIIHLDQDNFVDHGPIVIDDEKENNSSQENTDCYIETNTNELYDDGKVYNNISNAILNKVNSNNENVEPTLNNVNKKENQSSCDDCYIEINDDELSIPNNDQKTNGVCENNSRNETQLDKYEGTELLLNDYSHNKNITSNSDCHTKHADNTENVAKNDDHESHNHTSARNNLSVQTKKGLASNRSPQKLLIPQKEVGLSNEDVSPKISDLQKIKIIEQEIAMYKQWINKLDKQEVNDDDIGSPYVTSDRYKKKIVDLYKKLCILTGTEAIKKCEVRLTVIEGHPPGPVRRLERFLNRNIGEDGNPPFPDFNDVVRCVELANVNDNLCWNKLQVMKEAYALFTHCGRALQKRRQKREWKILISRVEEEECNQDPADNDPELQARLEANRLIAVKREADIIQRYSMMQDLPPETKNARNRITIANDADEDASNESFNHEILDEYDSPRENFNKISPTITNVTNKLDSSDLMFHLNSNLRNANSGPETSQFNSVVQDDGFILPKIIAKSITNKVYTDEFGLKINDSNISNVTVNSSTNFAVNIPPNFECDIATNKTNVARLNFESNFESFVRSNAEQVNFKCNVIHKTREAPSKLELPVQTMQSDTNYESNAAKSVAHIARLIYKSHVDASHESNIQANIGQGNYENNAAITKKSVARLTFENYNDGTSEANMLELKHEPIIEKVCTERIEEVNLKSKSTEVISTETSIHIESDKVDIKVEPTENVVKILNDFGENYTVSIFNIEDPFLVVEISDTSDEED